MLLLLCALSACPTQPCLARQTSAADSHEAALRRAAVGVEALQKWYDPQTGLYRTTGWWNSANAITTLADFMRASGSRQYAPILANTFARGQAAAPPPPAAKQAAGSPGFLNDYYDDEGWWALAWIDGYDLTGDGRYLDMARSIFADMAGGWDATCNGGIWWSKDRKYKNAIANELFFSVAAHLASRATAPGETRFYDNWADKEWQWFQDSGMINNRHLVNDGLAIDPATRTCRNNGQTPWTYNQGVVLGALAERFSATRDPAFLGPARAIADAALARLTGANGILHDRCEPDCGKDGVQFKGIFVRNLGALNRAVRSPRYVAFIRNNANSVWTADQAREHRFGVVWSGPASALGAGTQASALDALVAASSTPIRPAPLRQNGD